MSRFVELKEEDALKMIEENPSFVVMDDKEVDGQRYIILLKS